MKVLTITLTDNCSGQIDAATVTITNEVYTDTAAHRLLDKALASLDELTMIKEGEPHV